MSGMSDDAGEAGDGSILLVCSGGGHLSQLLVLRPWWERHRRVWVSFPTENVRSALEGEQLVPCHHPTTRHVGNLLRNTLLARRLLRSQRPGLIVTTGAALAIPFVLLGRLLKIPTAYLEVYDRVNSRTVSGRVCRPFCDLFMVQWPEQQDLYRGSVLVGPLW